MSCPYCKSKVHKKQCRYYRKVKLFVLETIEREAEKEKMHNELQSLIEKISKEDKWK